VAEPPDYILNAAVESQYGSLGEESDRSKIAVVRPPELGLYRITWLYVWEQQNCGACLFLSENHTVEASGKKSNARLLPAVRAGEAFCCPMGIWVIGPFMQSCYSAIFVAGRVLFFWTGHQYSVLWRAPRFAMT